MTLPGQGGNMATKAPKHKENLWLKLIFGSWWRKCFATKSTKITIKRVK
jgi:hypothetical protein